MTALNLAQVVVELQSTLRVPSIHHRSHWAHRVHTCLLVHFPPHLIGNLLCRLALRGNPLPQHIAKNHDGAGVLSLLGSLPTAPSVDASAIAPFFQFVLHQGRHVDDAAAWIQSFASQSLASVMGADAAPTPPLVHQERDQGHQPAEQQQPIVELQQQLHDAQAQLAEARAQLVVAQQTERGLVETQRESDSLRTENKSLQERLAVLQSERFELRARLAALQSESAALINAHAAERTHGAIASAFLAVRDLDEFDVVQLLGSGSFAIVLKCRPRAAALARLIPQLALKFMVNYGKSSKTASKDFYKEYAILAGLVHDNVVRMYWVKGLVLPSAAMLATVDESVRDLAINQVTGEPLKTTAVVMELHRGTLAHHYRQHGRNITPAQKLRMCGDLLRALLYVWEHRLVHFDVKFDNVLVAEDGRLVLSDFGTAQEVDADGCFEATGPLIGNQEHMAPEVLQALATRRGSVRIQASGQPCWECGTMFYEMITGSFPYATYPLCGLAAGRYPDVDAGSLDAVHPSLTQITLGLICWAPDLRMSLADAQACLPK